MKQQNIDGGRVFDWGRTSPDYARYRDIYPPEFYQRLLDAGICSSGQRVLDIGTGTGVLPRALYPYGADFVGVDLAENQILQARELAQKQGMEIDFRCSAAEALEFPAGSFDAVTACQCFVYFEHPLLAPALHRFLKKDGRFAVLYMAWLPEEDKIAGASEQLVLKYNPNWTGCGETRRPIGIPEDYGPYFELEQSQVFDLQVPFTRESWNGRIKACRGVGASLSDAQTAAFEQEHLQLLERIAPEAFEVLHYAAVAILRRKG